MKDVRGIATAARFASTILRIGIARKVTVAITHMTNLGHPESHRSSQAVNQGISLAPHGAHCSEKSMMGTGKYCRVVVLGTGSLELSLFVECEVCLESSRASGKTSPHSRFVWNSGSHVSNEMREGLVPRLESIIVRVTGRDA